MYENMYANLTTLIFDMDGVITSERKYWNTARLTVLELISSDQYLGLKNYFDEGNTFSAQVAILNQMIISSDFIYELKRRAVNSNWDLTFFVFSLYFISILKEFQQNRSDLWNNMIDLMNLPIEDGLIRLGEVLRGQVYNFKTSNLVITQFWQETEKFTGMQVVEHLQLFAKTVLNADPKTDLKFLQPKGKLWELCYHNFQAWYEGKRNYTLPDDDTVVELEHLKQLFNQLSGLKQYNLGIATGRPRSEVLQPLTALGLLHYFDSSRIGTYDEVLQAEALISQSGHAIRLAKPHPFVLLKAIHPDQEIHVLCSEAFQNLDRSDAAYIGDAASDVVAAKRSGCVSIGVLTGCVDDRAIESQRTMLLNKGCHTVLNSVLDLPKLLGVSL